MKRMTQTLDGRIDALGEWLSRRQHKIDRIGKTLIVLGIVALFGLTWRWVLPGPIAPWWIAPIPIPVSWLTVVVPVA
jgi:hypothetical protein